MQNETTCSNLVKEYFDAFIKCIHCQKEDVEEPQKQTELTASQLNSNAANIISSTFDTDDAVLKSTRCSIAGIQIYLDENNSNNHVELTTPSNNSIKTDENISINFDGNNKGYFIKEDYIDKKEENLDKKEDKSEEDDDNFEIV